MSRFLHPLNAKPLRSPAARQGILLQHRHGLWSCRHPESGGPDEGLDLEGLLERIGPSAPSRSVRIVTDLLLDLPLEAPPAKGIRPREFEEVLRWELPVLLDRHPDRIPPEWPRHSETFYHRAYALPGGETRVSFLPAEAVNAWENKLRRAGFTLEALVSEAHHTENDPHLPWIFLQRPAPKRGPVYAAAAAVLLLLALHGLHRVNGARREVDSLRDRLGQAETQLRELNQLWEQQEEGLEERRALQSERDRLRAQLQRARADSLADAWPRHHQPDYHARLLRGLSAAFPGEPSLLRHATDPQGRVFLSGHTRHDGALRAAHLRLLAALEGEIPPELLFTSSPDLIRPGRLAFQTDPRDSPPPPPQSPTDDPEDA